MHVLLLVGSLGDAHPVVICVGALERGELLEIHALLLSLCSLDCLERRSWALRKLVEVNPLLPFLLVAPQPTPAE